MLFSLCLQHHEQHHFLYVYNIMNNIILFMFTTSWTTSFYLCWQHHEQHHFIYVYNIMNNIILFMFTTSWTTSFCLCLQHYELLTFEMCFDNMVKNLMTIIFHLWINKIKPAHDEQIFQKIKVCLAPDMEDYQWYCNTYWYYLVLPYSDQHLIYWNCLGYLLEGGKAKHQLRIQIYELRVQIHELLIRMHKLRVQILKSRVQIHELWVQIHKLRVKFHELGDQKHELED